MMKPNEFSAVIQKLEQDCLAFTMTESDYDALLDYLLSTKHIRYLKKHYDDQPMNYFDLIGLEVEYINPQMARVIKVNNPAIKTIQPQDVIVSINRQADFFGRIEDNCRDIRLCAIRGYCQAEPSLIEEILPFPVMPKGKFEIKNELFQQHLCGIIRLRDFNFSVSGLEEALQQFTGAGVETLVFDLRGNMGGSVERMSKLLDLLLEKDTVKFYCVDKQEKIMVQRSRIEKTYRFDKIVILVNSLTLSSAEIFTAALKEENRAIVVGERTGGKGTIIAPLTIGECSYLMFPRYLCLTPKKNELETVGIVPDFSFSALADLLPPDVCAALQSKNSF